MKKFFTRGLILSLILALAIFTLVGCQETPPTPIDIDNVDRIIVEIVDIHTVDVSYSNADFEKEMIYYGNYSEKTLGDLLDRLSDENVLVAKSQTTEYGAFYTEIGNLKPSMTGYLSLYTSLADRGSTDWAEPISYGEISLLAATVGASSLPMQIGAVYLIIVIN